MRIKYTCIIMPFKPPGNSAERRLFIAKAIIGSNKSVTRSKKSPDTSSKTTAAAGAAEPETTTEAAEAAETTTQENSSSSSPRRSFLDRYFGCFSRSCRRRRNSPSRSRTPSPSRTSGGKRATIVGGTKYKRLRRDANITKRKHR